MKGKKIKITQEEYDELQRKAKLYDNAQRQSAKEKKEVRDLIFSRIKELMKSNVTVEELKVVYELYRAFKR